MKINLKKIGLGILSLGAIGLIATTPIVSAFQGDPTQQGPDFDADLHDLKVDAFDSQDYEVWKDLMEQSGNSGRVLDVVTEENFNTFVEAHNAALSGDMELAKELRSELGLNDGVGPKDGTGYKNDGEGKGMGSGNGQGMRQGDQANFVDTNGDEICDNDGENTRQGQGKGRR